MKSITGAVPWLSTPCFGLFSHQSPRSPRLEDSSGLKTKWYEELCSLKGVGRWPWAPSPGDAREVRLDQLSSSLAGHFPSWSTNRHMDFIQPRMSVQRKEILWWSPGFTFMCVCDCVCMCTCITFGMRLWVNTLFPRWTAYKWMTYNEIVVRWCFTCFTYPIQVGWYSPEILVQPIPLRYRWSLSFWDDCFWRAYWMGRRTASRCNGYEPFLNHWYTMPLIYHAWPLSTISVPWWTVISRWWTVIIPYQPLVDLEMFNQCPRTNTNCR